MLPHRPNTLARGRARNRIGADTITLPIRILTYLEWQFDPSIAAISTIFVLVTTAVVAAAEALTGMSRRPSV